MFALSAGSVLATLNWDRVGLGSAGGMGSGVGIDGRFGALVVAGLAPAAPIVKTNSKRKIVMNLKVAYFEYEITPPHVVNLTPHVISSSTHPSLTSSVTIFSNIIENI